MLLCCTFGPSACCHGVAGVTGPTAARGQSELAPFYARSAATVDGRAGTRPRPGNQSVIVERDLVQHASTVYSSRSAPQLACEQTAEATRGSFRRLKEASDPAAMT